MVLREFTIRVWRLASEVVLQTVPPALLSAYAASQLAAATGSSFTEAATVIACGLLACLMISASRP